MKNKSDEYVNDGQAIHDKFLRDDKGWRIFVTIEKRKYISNNQLELGAIGIDLNVNHLAVTETERTGNPIKSFDIALCTYGKSTNQARAFIVDAVKVIVKC